VAAATTPSSSPGSSLSADLGQSAADPLSQLVSAQERQRLIESLIAVAEKGVGIDIKSQGDVVGLTLQLMSAIQDLKQFQGKGGAKKVLLLETVKALIERHVKSPGDRSLLLGLSSQVLPPMIDTFVGLARGTVDIGKARASLLPFTRNCGCNLM
jgi:hypothetical protein